ncbi:MAG: lysophospholipid acyltransferase family protein [Melioribacter sp.]|nr:lysophospholipid acyltransferase family protein [Melioribacter sp.]
MLNKNRIEFFFFNTLNKIFKKIGLKKTRKLAKIIGLVVYYLLPIRKKTVLQNLRTAFPEKDEKEIKKIAKKNYQNISITFCELLLIPHLKLSEVKEQVSFENLELVKKNIEKKEGLIILTGHFGNWEILISSIVAYINAKYHVLVKPQRNQYITQWLKETRSVGNTNVIASGISVKEIIKALRSGEVVLIAGDQRGPFEGHRFQFFNHPTSLYTGTASIALKTKSNVLLAAVERQKDYKYKVFIEELDFNNLPENDEEKSLELTQRYISFLERYIRKSPEQYFWMHKLWKY